MRTLAYDFDHRGDIDRRIAEHNAFVEVLRERTPSKLSHRLRPLHGEDQIPDASIGEMIRGALLIAEVLESDAMMNHVAFL